MAHACASRNSSCSFVIVLKSNLRLQTWHLAHRHKDLDDRDTKPLKGSVPVVCIPGIIKAEREKLTSGGVRFACTHCAKHLGAGASEDEGEFLRLHLSKKYVSSEFVSPFCAGH